MNKWICTTTINKPTDAIQKFVAIARRDGWKVAVAGDQKTPYKEWRQFASENEDVVRYIEPAFQDTVMHAELSRLIGWNCIQRRNFAMLFAYLDGAEIIAVVDDDNIPFYEWGQNCHVNNMVMIDQIVTDEVAFNPILQPHSIWHRGYPIQLAMEGKHINTGPMQEVDVYCRVQADLWDGAPDIDAVCRINQPKTSVDQFTVRPYSSNAVGPFNSQNTFLSRSVMSHYFLFPHIGRMDDIWASFNVQFAFPGSVIYSEPSVFQDRNEHNIFKDLQAEMLGYEHNLDILKNGTTDYLESLLPEDSLEAYKIWQKLIKEA